MVAILNAAANKVPIELNHPERNSPAKLARGEISVDLQIVELAEITPVNQTKTLLRHFFTGIIAAVDRRCGTPVVLDILTRQPAGVVSPG